jgi:phosphoglycolate phosphatase
MVGDTVWDIEMAQRAGVASCAVTWGNHSAARLSGADPTHTADSWSALAAIIQSN